MTLTHSKRSWVEKLNQLMVGAIMKAIRSSVVGMAINSGGDLYNPIALLDDRLISFAPFKLPRLLTDQIGKTVTCLTFPQTSWLPDGTNLATALICGLGDAPQWLLWVGRRHASMFTDSERNTFGRFAERIHRLLVPFLPFFGTRICLRTWLEDSTQSDINFWLEENISLLLELLLTALDSQDGAILLMDQQSQPKFGISTGEGKHLLSTINQLAFLSHPNWVSKSVMENRWTGVVCCKVKPSQRYIAEQTLDVISKALCLLITWGKSSSWLESLVWRDPLTQLLNRNAFVLRLDSELDRACRYGYPVGVLMADLDGFKLTNELLGYHAGDEILKRVSQSLRQLVRRYDLVCRYGSDEFIVSLPAADLEESLAVAERIRTSIHKEVIDYPDSHRCSLGVSVGVTVAGCDDGYDIGKLLPLVNKALMLAKSKGGNRIEVTLCAGVTKAQTVANRVQPQFWSRLVQYLNHNINNPSAGILGLTQLLLQEDKPAPHMVREALEQIEQLAFRLRDFSHHISHSPIAEILKELDDLSQQMRSNSFAQNMSLPTKGA